MTPREFRARRYELGLTQEQMAKRLDVHPMTVSKWERGVHDIPASVTLAIGMPEQSASDRHDGALYVANLKLDDVTQYPPFDIRDFASAMRTPAVRRYRFTAHGEDFVLEQPRDQTAWTVRPAAHPDYSGVLFADQVTAVYWAIIEAAHAWPHATEDDNA